MSLDVLPRRNLGLAENWGRSLEGRVGKLVDRFGVEIQSLRGLGRYSAASSEQLARNAQRIEKALLEMPYYFTEGASNPSPAVGTGWSSIASLDVAVPEGKTGVEILAMANATLPYPSGGGSTTKFSWPFPLSLVTSEYGPRDGGFHEGIDFAGGAASGGNPIPAAGDGVVADSVIGHPGWGNYVRLEHNVDGTLMSTLYAHMDPGPVVSAGATVVRGQTLGYVGNTGASFGNHLHFETWTGTSFGTHADPRWFMTMYGEEDAPPSAPPKLRLVIAGVTSIEFSGLISETIPITLTYVPVFGRSFATDDPFVNVSLEAISGAAVTGTAATLAVTGSFHV